MWLWDREVRPPLLVAVGAVSSQFVDTTLAVAIVAASASMVTGMFGMWINASQTGKRIDDMGNRFVDLGERFDDLRADFKELRNEVKDFRTEFNAFREMVNGKLQSIRF